MPKPWVLWKKKIQPLRCRSNAVITQGRRNIDFSFEKLTENDEVATARVITRARASFWRAWTGALSRGLPSVADDEEQQHTEASIEVCRCRAIVHDKTNFNFVWQNNHGLGSGFLQLWTIMLMLPIVTLTSSCEHAIQFHIMCQNFFLFNCWGIEMSGYHCS